MHIRDTVFSLIAALLLSSSSATAASAVYVVNDNSQFGTLNLTTGAFTQIGPATPEGETGLVPGPTGSLLTLTYSGNLDSINPVTGATIVIGPTGLADCTTPASPCGPSSASTLGYLNGKIYATDFQNNLYSVNPLTGAATLIGKTGIPSVPSVPFSMNPDGSFNFYDEGIVGAGGKLFATFDAASFNPATSVNTPTIAPELYEIDPSSGLATLIGPTALGVDSMVEANGTFYAFSGVSNQVMAIDLGTGSSSIVGVIDPSAGVIAGAVSPVPEPGSATLVAIAIVLLGVWGFGRRRLPTN
jgi:hypothetical protein